jgi:YD repeat-containing protein
MGIERDLTARTPREDVGLAELVGRVGDGGDNSLRGTGGQGEPRWEVRDAGLGDADAGNITSRKYPDGTAVSYKYNADGGVLSTTAGSAETTYS